MINSRPWLLATIVAAWNTVPLLAADPLPSWNDTASKQAIVAFVEKVTRPGSSATVIASDP